MKYYTVKEIAKKFRVSESVIYKLVKKGEIKKVEGLGSSVRIPSTELKNINFESEKERFSYNENLVQVIDTHLGKVRKVKGKDEYVVSDLAKVLGLKDSYTITRRADKKQYKKIEVKEARELGIFVNQYGLLLITYKGIGQYSKKSRSKDIIHFERLLKELKVNDYEQVKFKGVEDKSIKLANMFEGRNVEIILVNEQPLFELYSTGMALGYARDNGKTMGEHGVHKLYPYKSRIDKMLENADIKPVVHNGQQYLNEEMLYDFMLEAKTEKCKSFRKWVTNEVLPTIRKNGGYVDNTNKFTDFYFSNLSLEVRQSIKKELVNRNNEILIITKQLETESTKLKHEYDVNQKAMEQLNV